MIFTFTPGSFRQFHEIFQQLKADLLAFLRVKLRGVNIGAPDGRRKGATVIRARGDDGLIRWLRKKAVDEISVAAVFNSAKQGAIVFRNLNLIPANLGDFKSGLFRETDDAALK